jgi:hypothetical protein
VQWLRFVDFHGEDDSHVVAEEDTGDDA